MATQTLEFGATTDETLTAKLFAEGSDTVVQTASTVTEATNRGGRYSAVFTDVPAGRYLLVYYANDVGLGSENYTLTLTTSTFYPWAETEPMANSGIYVINVSAVNEDDDAVSGLQVYLLGTTQRKVTGTLGTTYFNVDGSDTYTLRFVTPPGYDDIDDIEVTVGTSDVDQEVSLTSSIVEPATDLALCNVEVRVLSQYGDLIEGATVWAEVVPNILYRSSAIVMDIEATETTVTGSVVLPLVRLVKYRIFISYEDKVKTITYTVPNSASAIATEEV